MLWQQPASKKLGSGQQKAGNVSGAKKKRKKNTWRKILLLIS